MGKLVEYGKERISIEKNHFISTENMQQNCAGIIEYCDNSQVEGIAFHKDDMLVANIRPYLKKAWFASFSGACSTDVLVVHATNVEPRFLHYLISNDTFFSYVMTGAKGSKMPRGDKTHIIKMPTAIPSSGEQIKIASFIEILDSRIDIQKQIIEFLKKYKRGLSSRAFDGKSCSITLGDFCIITMGQSPDSTSYNTKNIGLPLVQGNADMKGRKTCPQRFTSNPTKTCDEGAIILSVRAPVGTVGIADQKICLGRGVCSITCEDREYVYQYLLYHEDSWKNIEQGGTFTAISGDDIRRFPLYFPDEPERKKISSLLTVMDKRIATSTIILERLTECKSALLQQLFI